MAPRAFELNAPKPRSPELATVIPAKAGIQARCVVTLQDIFVFEKRGLNPDGHVVGRFAATGIRPKFYEKLLAAGIRLRADLFDEVVEV